MIFFKFALPKILVSSHDGVISAKKMVLKKFWHWYFSKFWSCHTVGVPVDPIIANCCNQNSWLFSKMIFQIGGELKFSPDGTTTTLRRMMMRAGRWMRRGTSTQRPFGTSSLGEAWTQAMSIFKRMTVLKKDNCFINVVRKWKAKKSMFESVVSVV